MATKKTATSKVTKPRAKREKSTSDKGHYISNADLIPAIMEAKQEKAVTAKLILMIRKIAENYSRKGSFVNYSFRDDMVSAAVENMCKNALKFDETKYSNPFAYYTTGIYHSFLQYMADEKKHRNLRDLLLIDAGSNPSFNFLQGEKDEQHFEIKESDEHYVPETVATVDAIEEVPAEVELDEDGNPINEPVREVKVRYVAHQPGPVARLSAGDFILDPVTGIYVRKPQPEPVVQAEPVFEEPPKKVRKPRAKPVKVEPVEEIVPVKAVKPRAKKISTGFTLPEAKLTPLACAKKAAAEKPAKKAVANKAAPKKTVPAAKKVATKKPAAKKTPKSSNR